MKHATIALTAFAIAVSSSTLFAQRSEIEPPLERAQRFIEERKQTRPRLAPPPVGRPPARTETPDVDWNAARALVAATERRRLANLSNVTATRAVVFERTAGVRAATAENLKQARAAEVAAVAIPVLIPDQERVRDTVQIFGQADAYTAIAEVADGVDMRMSGSRKRLVLERPPARREALQKMRAARPPLPGVDAAYVITRSESSTDLSFSRFNVGYVLALICDDPENDARCAEDDFIVALASSLALLNDRGEAGQ